LKIYKENRLTLKNILDSCRNEYEARDIIVNNTIGIGYKQASLFLRNILYSENLAILDTHIIRYMRLLNMVENELSINLSNKYTYLKLENVLRNYAELKDKSMSSLDLAIWIVMRVLQREYVK